jgi:hypothetical protein
LVQGDVILHDTTNTCVRSECCLVAARSKIQDVKRLVDR